MSEASPPLPPRVTVTLPGGVKVSGRIHAWRSGTDGRWSAQVTIKVPAATVQPVAGEDYSEVPRGPAVAAAEAPGPISPRWAIAAVGRTAGGREVHRTDRCWLHLVAVQPATQQEAAAAIRAGTPACPVCRPDQP